MKNFDGFAPTKQEFDKRVKHNLSLYKEDRFEFWNYKFFDIEDTGNVKNPHADTLSKSINDMRGAIPLGQLAIYSLHGADAFMYKNGEYIDTELKTIEIDETKLIVGADDVIYYEAPNLKRTTIENFYSISFVITNEALRKSKDRPTFLVLRTKGTGETIDAFYLPGEIIYRELCKGDLNISTKSVSLKTFINEGKKEKVLLPHVGWDNWKKRILKNNTYLIRPMKQEDIKKQFSAERLEFRKMIAENKEELKNLATKISKANRLAGGTETQIRKEDEKLSSIDEQLKKLNLRKNNIIRLIQSKMGRTVKLQEMIKTIGLIVDKIEFSVNKTYEKIDESYQNEEKKIEANIGLRKLIKNPE